MEVQVNEREKFKSTIEYNRMTQDVVKIRVSKPMYRALSYLLIVVFIAGFIFSNILIEMWGDDLADKA